MGQNVKFLKFFASNDFYSKSSNLLNHFEFKNCLFFSASKNLMQKIVGHKLHNGVMALAEKPKSLELFELLPPYLILNGLTDPENVGTIIRSSAAFNINSIIVDSKTCSPYLKRCIRVSMGHVLKTKIFYSKNLLSTIDKLKANNTEIIGTTNRDANISLSKYNFIKNSALIIGSEGEGVDQDIKNVCDALIRITLNKNVSSINAANAASIFLYHLSRSMN